MSGVAEYIKTDYLAGPDLGLESAGRGEQIKNRIVAALLNYGYPLLNPLLARSKGELAQLWFRTPGYEKSSWRTFEAFYHFEEKKEHGDLGNKLLMASPGVRASRNRKKIALRLLENQLKEYSGSPVLVNNIGGGSGSRELRVIKNAGRRDIFYCSTDTDSAAADYGDKEAKQISMSMRSFFASKKLDFSSPSEVQSFFGEMNQHYFSSKPQFHAFDISLLLGVTEYCDLHTRANTELDQLLQGLHQHTSPRGRMIMGQTDHHDRVRYVEKGLGWKMRLRSQDEIADHIERSGWNILYCEKEPMNVITMILAEKKD